jgi:hypothetical protein
VVECRRGQRREAGMAQIVAAGVALFADRMAHRIDGGGGDIAAFDLDGEHFSHRFRLGISQEDPPRPGRGDPQGAAESDHQGAVLHPVDLGDDHRGLVAMDRQRGGLAGLVAQLVQHLACQMRDVDLVQCRESELQA